MVRTSRRSPFLRGWNDWYADWRVSGGVLLDLVIHDFDFLRWTLGEVERVYARGVLGREYNRLDYALVTLRFEGGAIAHVEGHWGYPGPFNYSIEVAGSRALLTADSTEPATLELIGGMPEQDGVPDLASGKSPYETELEHFVRCIATGEEPIVKTARRLRGAQDQPRRHRVGPDRRTRDAGRPRMSIRVGIVSFAHVHAPAYAAVLWDSTGGFRRDHGRRRGSRRERPHENFGVRFFENADSLFEEVDAVVVCSENRNHVRDVIPALEGGVHVLCEKPIATTVEDAWTMIQSLRGLGQPAQNSLPRTLPALDSPREGDRARRLPGPRPGRQRREPRPDPGRLVPRPRDLQAAAR